MLDPRSTILDLQSSILDPRPPFPCLFLLTAVVFSAFHIPKMRKVHLMKTHMANAQTAKIKWYLVDAKGKTLGRLASALAFRLRGKHKVDYTPHVAMGDCMVVINVDQIKVTGDKAEKKLYYHHTGYPGGIKEESFENLHARKPEKVLELAVKGMLPRGPLGREMFRRLKVYAGTEHPHTAQKPKILEIEG